MGIGTNTPGQKLDVVGITKTNGLQVTDGAGSGKVLTSDAVGNATWQSTISNNFVFAYSSTTQAVVSPGLFQNITFNSNVEIDGWSHPPGTAQFTCNQTGKYLITLMPTFTITSGGFVGAVCDTRFAINGIAVIGSSNSTSLTVSNAILTNSSNSIITVLSGDILTAQLGSNSSGCQLLPSPNSISPVKPSAKITIQRLQ